MPQRFLRPGIRDSQRFNSVSFAAQSLYIRLLTLVDDWGRYDGRDSVIWAHCFAVWNDQQSKEAVSLKECCALSVELQLARLWEVHEFEGKRVIQVTQWSERVRGESKWPIPSDSTALRIPADSCGKLPNPASPAFSPSHEPSPLAIGATHVESDPLPVPENLKTPEFINAWQKWQTVRRGMKKPGNWLILFQEQLRFLTQFNAQKATEILNQSVRNGWQGLFETKEQYGKNRNTGTSINPAADRRNAGTIKGVTDYGEAAKRLQERQRTAREAGAVADRVAKNEPPSPAIGGNGG